MTLTPTKVERWLRPFSPTRRAVQSSPSGDVVELTVRVRQGPAGRTASLLIGGREVVKVPFLVRYHEDRAAQRLADLLDSTQRSLGPRGQAAVEAYGSELFDAIFPKPAHDHYRTALCTALEANSRLRILLDLDQQTRDLPWEYLFDADRAQFLAMSSDTSVIRLLDTNQTRRADPIETLRVLVMATNPRGTAPLHADAEIDQLQTQLAAIDRVALRTVDGETLEDLRMAARDFSPHVVHLVAHGQWFDDADDGAVIFADEQGNPRPVSGRELAVALKRKDLRLVLCNSCNGARTSLADPFAGVTESLVAQGVPAAVGMQYRIENRAASSFGTTFLTALAKGDRIDDALTEARTAVYTAHNGIEWATPVLTSRVPVDEILTWASTDSPLRSPRPTSTNLMV